MIYAAIYFAFTGLLVFVAFQGWTRFKARRKSRVHSRMQQSITRPVRITEDKARSLLRQCRVLLIAMITAFVLLMWLLSVNKESSYATILLPVWILAGLGYIIQLGRLAHGLGRSVVYYVGGTFIAAGAILFFAHIIAYFNVRSAVKEIFPDQNARTQPQ